MIPRQSYFNKYRQEVRDHFVEFTSSFDKKDDVWFEFNDLPLPWHLPAGALYDFKSNSKELPWHITVHFMGFPQEKLMKFSTNEELSWNFFNTLKEACFIKYGSTKSIMTLSKNDQDALWKSIIENNFIEFDKCQTKLEESEPKKQPVRIFTQNNNVATLYTVSKNITLGDFILECKIDELKDVQHYKAIIQGVETTMDTPMEWLTKNCSHPDQFLYIIIKW
jgi:autophagy-related protein 5